MSTHDQFKAKGNTIPKGKFSFLIASQQTSSTGRPRTAHDRSRILCTRDVRQMCYKRSGGSRCRNGGNGHAHQSERGGMRLKVELISNMRRPRGLEKATIRHINDSRCVVVDTFANQISFCGLLFGVFRLVVDVFGPVKTHGDDWIVWLVGGILVRTASTRQWVGWCRVSCESQCRI